jgi:hypothetical protein
VGIQGGLEDGPPVTFPSLAAAGGISKERRKSMNVEQIKYHPSPDGDEEGILLVDPESETLPLTDSDGNLQYYCVGGKYVFSVDEDND